METNEFYTRFLVALALGLLLGIERGWKQRDSHAGEREAGIRTFTLIALTGFAAGLAGATWGPAFPAVIGAGVLTLVVVSYFSDAAKANSDRGMTTEVASFLTLVIGILCAAGLLMEAAVCAVVSVALLDQKPLLHGFVQGLQRFELTAALKVLLLSVVLLPLLPNEGMGPGNILNPYELCLAVVVIAVMGLAGYAAMKIAGGERGAMLMGLLGGLVSSTSVTVSASKASLQSPQFANSLAGGIAIAQTVMFARTAALITAINPALLPEVGPSLALGGLVALGGAAFAALLARRNSAGGTFAPETADTLGAALKFVLFAAVVMVVSYYAQAYAGNAGVILSGLLSGAVDVDAATVSASRMTSAAVNSQTSLAAAALSISVAVLANSVVKSAISFSTGARPLAWVASTILLASGLAAFSAAAVAYAVSN